MAATTCLVVACTSSPHEQPRFASLQEAKEILREYATPLDGFCITRKIGYPLEVSRRYAEDARLSRTWLANVGLMLKPLISDNIEKAANQWHVAEPIMDPPPVSLGEGTGLERKLRRAIRMKVPSPAIPTADTIFPTAMVEPMKADQKLPCGKFTGYEISLTWPVLVGDTAFVEAGEHCGGLCGQGSVDAFQKKGGKWHLTAKKVTWLA